MKEEKTIKLNATRSAFAPFAIFVAATLVACLMIGSAKDLQISFSLSALTAGENKSTNAFAVAVEIFGEIISMMIAAAAVPIVFAHASNNVRNRAISRFLTVLGIIISALISVLASRKIYSGLNDNFGFGDFSPPHISALWIVSVAALIFIATFSPATAIKTESTEKLFRWAAATILAIIISAIAVKILKRALPRARFRAMNAAGDFSAYAPWFRPRSFTDEMRRILTAAAGQDALKSFPSGHASAGAAILSLAALPDFDDGLKNPLRINVLRVGSFLVFAAIGLGRVVGGAHFLSDVSFGGLIFLSAFSGLIIVLKKLEKPTYSAIKRKNDNKDNSERRSVSEEI